jgi:S-(hydroxymethyl)glutathione dehydrogenase/alcohol dehydrogenase
MKMKAAVCREFGKPISIEEVELAPPKEKEVLVKTAYTGFCHSDWSAVAGWLPFPTPMVIGHEASGVVMDVGPGVTTVKKGDHVVATWMIACGHCPECTSGRGYICRTSHGIHTKGGLWDGTSRLTDAKGARLNHQTFVSGFAEYMVIPEQGAILMPKNFPLDQACFIGCCVPTGYGAVYNVAKIIPGNSAAIWGMGGVGLNVVRGAKLRGAYPIIGVDVEGSKEAIAREFGATHFINSSKEDPVQAVQLLTGGEKMADGTIQGGGANFCFEVIGDPGAIQQAYWALSIGGSLIQVGIPSIQTRTELPLTLTPPHNRNIIGTLYGNVQNHYELPAIVSQIERGEYMDLSKLISKKFKIEEINEVYQAMSDHEIIGRWVCEWD